MHRKCFRPSSPGNKMQLSRCLRLAARRPGAAVHSQPAAPELLQRLHLGIEYELVKGFQDFKGATERFSEFLASSLEQLHRTEELNARAAEELRRLKLQAGRYPLMSHEQRKGLLTELKKALPLDQAAAAESGGSSGGVWTVREQSWAEQAVAAFQPPQGFTTLVPILFDLEATGLGAKGAHPVEIVARSMLSGQQFSTLIRLADHMSMSEKAGEITGLTTEQLRDPSLPDFRTAYLSFLDFIQAEVAARGAGAVPLLVGHNIVQFDVGMLLARACACDLPAPRAALMLDTCLTARAALPSNVSKSLVELHKRYTGAAPESSHRAMADVQATERVLPFLLREAGAAERTWEQLFGDPALGRLFNRGWVGELPAAPGPQQQPPTPPQQEQRGGRRSSAVVSRSSFGSSVQVAFTDGQTGIVDGRTSSADEAAAGVESTAAFAADDFSVEAWAADDPLAAVELENRSADGAAPTFDELAAAHASWRSVLSDPTLTSCFLTTPVAELKGAGKFTAKQLEDLEAAGLSTLSEVLECYPRGYTTAAAGALPSLHAPEEQAVCLAVQVKSSTIKKSAKNWAILAVVLSVRPPEEAGLAAPGVARQAYSSRHVELLYKIFRRGPYAAYAVTAEQNSLTRLGDSFVVVGRVDSAGQAGDSWALKDGSVELLSLAEARPLFASGERHIRVTYPQRGLVPPHRIEALVAKALKVLQESQRKWKDALPEWVRQRYALPGYMDALMGMHRPINEAHYESSRRRLAFQELMCLQLKLLLQRATLRRPRDSADLVGVRIADRTLSDLGQRALPYSLTGAQQRALDAIAASMAGWPPAMCLLQGDVGCGKTAVAFLALLAAVGSGYQAAIMAPTQILAEQHYAGMQRLLADMRAVAGREGGAAAARMPTVALLIGSTKEGEKAEILGRLAAGSVDVVVGTHTLTSDPVTFARLGFAVIDEQHKFGVEQRAKMLAKASPSPHLLSMSATPIPRSLALALHGELTLVTIDEMPPGRTPVATRVLNDSPKGREEMYAHMRREIAAGGQVYIVCPLVEDEMSGDGGGADGDREADLKAVVNERQRLVADGVLQAAQCGVLHGRLSAAEKEAALRAFANGAAPVIICTTVVEVGVDVTSASLIIVEHAERFGLASLHQLRGRVGRGERASSCYLVTDKGGADAERLKVLERRSSGFDVAEADFKMRGPGELLGRRQSGRDIVGALKACRLREDGVVLEAAREAAGLHMQRCRGRPEGWEPELLAAVADPSLLNLDLAELPPSL